MASAALCDQFDCQECRHRWFVDSPKRKYGELTPIAALPTCPNCGSQKVVKS